MSRLVAPVLAVLALLWLAAPARAGHIALTTELSLTPTSAGLYAVARFQNNGDAEALDVRPVLEVSGRRLDGPVFRAIPPGETRRAEWFTRLYGLPADDGLAVLRTRYRGEDLRPGTAVHAAVFSRTPGPPPGLQAFMDIFTLADRGNLHVVVQDTAGAAREAAGSLILPAAFGSTASRTQARVPAGGTAKLSFPVYNRHAQPGEFHSVYCVVEFGEGGRRRLVLAHDQAGVAEAPGWFTRTRPLWAALALLAAVGFLVARRFQAGRTNGYDERT